MIVYKATNKIDWLMYIGKTARSLEQRIKEHFKEKGYFPNSLRKYGSDGFWWEVICECYSEADMNEQEKWFIEVFNSKYPNGYNLTDGGEGVSGYHHTEEAKRRMGRPGEKNPMLGKKGLMFQKGLVKSIRCLVNIILQIPNGR